MKLISTILLLFCSFGFFSQKEISWDDLFFEIEEKWSEEYGAIYLVPKFEKKHKDLDSVKVKIKGFITPMVIEAEYYIISKNIFNFGGFCSGPPSNQGYEIIEISFNTKPSEINLKKEYWIEGTLILNEDDILQLNYILKDAVILEK
jgi:hypothetical protein